MKRKICVRSMVLGAGIMLIGLAVGAIVSPPLIAQRDGVFGEIQCRKLTVVDNMGKMAVVLASDEDSNAILITDKQGKLAVRLGSDEDVNSVIVRDKQGNPAVDLGGSENVGNYVAVNNKQQESVVGLYSGEYGGAVYVYENHGGIRAGMGVNQYGNGAVNTWDKNGYRQ